MISKSRCVIVAFLLWLWYDSITKRPEAVGKDRLNSGGKPPGLSAKTAKKRAGLGAEKGSCETDVCVLQ